MTSSPRRDSPPPDERERPTAPIRARGTLGSRARRDYRDAPRRLARGFEQFAIDRRRRSRTLDAVLPSRRAPSSMRIGTIGSGAEVARRGRSISHSIMTSRISSSDSAFQLGPRFHTLFHGGDAVALAEKKRDGGRRRISRSSSTAVEAHSRSARFSVSASSSTVSALCAFGVARPGAGSGRGSSASIRCRESAPDQQHATLRPDLARRQAHSDSGLQDQRADAWPALRQRRVRGRTRLWRRDFQGHGA